MLRHFTTLSRHKMRGIECKILRQRNECCDTMVIRRQNFFAIMDFCVATLIKKFLKKDVAILFCSIATMIKQMEVEFFLNNQIYVAT